MINTKGLNPARILKVLYDNSNPLGLGFLHYTPNPMSIEYAEKLLISPEPNLFGRDRYFDYVHGRVMKVDLSNPDEFEERLYDRDNGTGAAQKSIDSLTKEKDNE